MKLFKIYVGVDVCFDPNGNMIPKAIYWENNRRYLIEKIIDCRPAASLKAGGQGLRYLCRIEGKDRFLYYESPKWFVEKK